MAHDAQPSEKLQMLLRLVTGTVQDGQIHPQVPGVALSRGSDYTLQVTVTTQEAALSLA